MAQLKDNEFLVTGFFCRVDFRPVSAGKYRQFLRVEEGTYENGGFKFLRIWNGDETDWGLNFGGEPLVAACVCSSLLTLGRSPQRPLSRSSFLGTMELYRFQP